MEIEIKKCDKCTEHDRLTTPKLGLFERIRLFFGSLWAKIRRVKPTPSNPNVKYWPIPRWMCHKCENIITDVEQLPMEDLAIKYRLFCHGQEEVRTFTVVAAMVNTQCHWFAFNQKGKSYGGLY